MYKCAKSQKSIIFLCQTRQNLVKTKRNSMYLLPSEKWKFVRGKFQMEKTLPCLLKKFGFYFFKKKLFLHKQTKNWKQKLGWKKNLRIDEKQSFKKQQSLKRLLKIANLLEEKKEEDKLGRQKSWEFSL